MLLGSCSNGAAPSGAKDSSKAKVDPPTAESYPASVALYGDSLAMQARPYFKLLMAAADQSSTTYYSSFVGTAICDWLPRMRQLAVTTHFEAVVLEFSGNALTPCMAGIADYTPAYYAKYRADTMTAISIWVPTVAHVFLVGSPLTRANRQPCTGPVVEGVPSNVVRSTDGVHFCPVAEVDESCRVYSSGAFRFADAMVRALATPVEFPMTSPGG